MSFLKGKKANGFYVSPETDEISFVLEPLTAVPKQRIFAFQFPQNFSSILKDDFTYQVKSIN